MASDLSQLDINETTTRLVIHAAKQVSFDGYFFKRKNIISVFESTVSLVLAMALRIQIWISLSLMTCVHTGLLSSYGSD